MARDRIARASAAPPASRPGEGRSGSLFPSRRATLLLSLAIYALALVPRLVGLGRFAFPDEETWVERSLLFITGLARGDLMATWQNNHPGVVPMWGFSAMLWLRTTWFDPPGSLAALAKHLPAAEMPALLGTAALFTALATSLGVVGVFLLARRLFGTTVALLAAILVALDPFFLTHSRIVHLDGVLTALMICAALAFLCYLSLGEQKYLFASGVLWGLGLLTKSPALFLIPFVLLVTALSYLSTVGWRLDGPRLRRLTVAFAIWFAVGWAVFFLLWPAAWMHPLEMAIRIFKGSRWGVITSHGTNYFLGREVATPGPLYYAVILPLRLTPVTLIGLLLATPWLLRRFWRQARHPGLAGPLESRTVLGGVGLLAYVFFFALTLTLAAKKGERYLVPVFPAVDILTAMVLGAMVSWATVRWPALFALRHRGLILAVLLLFTLSLSWLRLAPYYGAYFNPLAGGGRAAAYAYPFGQGEGLDMAAAYLNAKPEAAALSAASFYPRQFSYTFRGTTRSLRRGHDWDGTWRFSDYVVFYISQVQRNLPTASLVRFFRDTQKPVFAARPGDVDFAWVYRSPALLSGRAPAMSGKLSANFDGRLALTGFDLGQTALVPGQSAEVALRWRAIRPVKDNYLFRLRLVDAHEQVLLSTTNPPYDGYFPTGLWPVGKEMITRYR
ncbi:MAG: glycosyltransferase family 39 protein, partial [Chloroflexi bacterium]|nr:glycosyltransferase family 39 protein [Chloroflexota bacterium]